MNEYAIHTAVIEHLGTRGVPGLIYYHCANGEKRHAATGARLKRMGVRPGVSDIILHHNGEAFALELKAPKKKLTAAQGAFLESWRAQSPRYHGTWADNLDDALAILKSWGLLR